MQACLWTEFITSNERADYKTWPRLCALAEMGWTPQPRRNYADFMDRLGPATSGAAWPLGVAYRVPGPGLETQGGSVEIKPPFAGAEIHYTTDGSEPTPKSPRWTGEPIHAEASQPVAACTFMPGGRRSLVAATAKSKK